MLRASGAFENAPVCLALSVLAFSSVLLELLDAKSLLAVESFSGQVLVGGELFRLWTMQLVAADSSAQLFLLLVTILQARPVERAMGWRRFAVLVALVLATAPLALAGFALAFEVDPYRGVGSGLVALVFALLAAIWRLVPAFPGPRRRGLTLKGANVLLVSHLLLVTGLRAVLHAVVGFAIAWTYLHQKTQLLPSLRSLFKTRR